MQYTKNSYSVKGFHYAIQISFTNMESSIWKLVPFNEGKKFSNKEKYNAKAGDESKAKKKIMKYCNKRLGRQMLRCNP